MITAEYFRTMFEKAVRAATAPVRVELHLHSGAIFEIEAVSDVQEGFVVLRAYAADEPDSAVDRARSRPKGADGDRVVLDRVVVPYESIACIHFAPAGKHAGRSAGFQQQVPARA